MATRIGFIGLGTMGRPMAANIQKGGFDLAVYDLREEPVRELAALGARPAQSCKEVAEGAEIIELAVPDDAAVEAAVLGNDGALVGAREGSVIAVHSTIHPDTVRKIAERARPKGVEVIDAQMSGGQAGAAGATLCFMVGGDRAALERCRPVFTTMGTHIFHVGPLGMGAMAKAAQQAITVINVLASSEGFRLAERAGVDLDAFDQLLRVSAGQSYITDNWLAHYRPMRSSEPRPFHRGLRAVLALGYDLDVPLPATALAQQTVPWAVTETHSGPSTSSG